MKLAVFGGTGRTGQHIVRAALEQGHEVVALARNPSKLALEHPRLTLVQGDVTDPACVDGVIAGAGAVISALGPTSNQLVMDVSRGMANILAAMKQHGVRRILVTAGAGVGDPADKPGPFNHVMNFLLKTIARNVLADMDSAVAMVRASGLDWTIVRLPMLTADPPKGSVRVGYVGGDMGPRIPRADIAPFLLKQLEDDAWLCKAPVISSK